MEEKCHLEISINISGGGSDEKDLSTIHMDFDNLSKAEVVANMARSYVLGLQNLKHELIDGVASD